MFKFLKQKMLGSAESRLADEALYAEALREVEAGLRRDGLWARALSECEMDQKKAAALYLELRVQSMKDELLLATRQAELNNIAARNRQHEIQRQQNEIDDADKPRHLNCGGIIDREEYSTKIDWKCRKCNASGVIKFAKI